MDQLAENYQLKWHSFSSYLHTFTIDGRQIMAHRFVLSACSQYLHQILKIQPKINSTLPLVIMLPPEINYKTMKTLIQYMYSGEATVSKDILEGVLRGGDILKVKGLYRPKEDEPPENKVAKASDPPSKPKALERDESLFQPETLSHSNSASPNILNYSLNAVKPGRKDGPEEKSDERRIKPSQNSVIKSTQQEKRAPAEDDKRSETSERSDKSDSSNELQYLVIKEEPIEWSEVAESDMELVDEKEVFSSTELTIKPEICMDDADSQQLYSPLTCELCTETFTLPAEWVRHVQTHTEVLPAKRQRRGKNSQDEESDAPFPQLHCDLCQKFFPTPAEWVHHIQNTHTEFELHLSNKTSPGKVFKSPRAAGPVQNLCTICSKKFPSHASLLIHQRTHTGEKPYMCETCYKGFNVKSNLLRHLRTVHDKILNPTDVDDLGKGETD